MKRLLTLTMLITMLGGMFVTTQPANAESSGPDICAAAANGEPISGYEVAWGRGGSGNQVVLGTDNPETMRGGSGNDVLCGFNGDDTLRGNSGNDVLVGGAGDDRLRGGSGNNIQIQDGATSGGGGGSNGGGDGDCEEFGTFAPESNPSLNFNSKEQCLAFVGDGGTVVAYDPTAPQIFIFDLSNCQIGVGLFRFPANQSFNVTITDSSGSTVANFDATTNNEGDSDLSIVRATITSGVYTAFTMIGDQLYLDSRPQPTTGSC